MNYILQKKKGICKNCHETETLYKIKIKKAGKEKIIGLCDLCLEGILTATTPEEKQEKQKLINRVL